MTTEEATEPNAVVVATTAGRYEMLKEMVEVLHVEASLQEGDTRSAIDFQMSIVEAILNAETEEEIFDAQEAGGLSGQDFINRPFTIFAEDVEFVQTAIKSGTTFPFYVRIKAAEMATGVEHNITCGGFSIVPVLYALRKRGFLNDETPKAMAFKSTATLSGNSRLSLVPYVEPKPRKASPAKASAK